MGGVCCHSGGGVGVVCCHSGGGGGGVLSQWWGGGVLSQWWGGWCAVTVVVVCCHWWWGGGVLLSPSLSILDEWARPIFGLASDFKSMTRDEREERDYANLSQEARRRIR